MPAQAPKKRRLRKLKIEEISLVDRPAQEHARVAILKRAVVEKVLPKPKKDEEMSDFVSRFMGDETMKEEYPDHKQRLAVAHSQWRRMHKRLALTSQTAGHAHSLNTALEGGEIQRGQTSWVEGHTHDWVMDDAGNIILADSMGHTHGIAVLVMKAEDEDLIKRTFSTEARERLAESGAAMEDGSFPVTDKASLQDAVKAFGRAKDKAAVARHIRRRARALGLTELLPEEGALADLLSKGEDAASDGTAEEANMTNQAPAGTPAVTKEQLEAVEKRAKRAESIVGLSAEQRAHFESLCGEEQDAFLQKSAEERDAIVKNAREADPVVYKDLDGNEYRKSADSTVLRLVKSNDELRKQAAEQARLSKRAGFEKRAADELGHLTGELVAKADLLEAVEALPEAKRAPVLAILKSKDAGMAKAFARVGHKTEDEKAGDDAITLIAKRLRDADPKLTEQQAYVKALDTEEGRRAVRELRSVKEGN